MDKKLTKQEFASQSDSQIQEPYGVAAWGLWFYILIAVGRFGELIPGLTAIPLAKIAISISLLGLIGDKKRYEKGPWAKSGIIGAAATVFVVAGLLVPISVQTGASMRFMLSTALPMAVGFYMVNRICISWRYIRMTIHVLMMSAVILALFAIIGGADRIHVSSTYDTNDLAYVLLTCLPIALGLAYSSSGKRRLLLYGASATMLFAAMLTQSRGGLLGAVAATIFLILRPYSGKKRSVIRALMAACLVTAVGYGAFNILPSAVQARFETLSELDADYNLDKANVTGRMSIWKRGVQAALDRPIGYGALTFEKVDLMNGGKYMAPHNSYLQIAVELGFFGLVMLLRLYYLSWVCMLRLKSFAERNIARLKPPISSELVPLSVGIRAGLLANMVAGFFLSQAYAGLLWTLFAIFSAMATLMVRNNLSMPASDHELTSTR